MKDGKYVILYVDDDPDCLAAMRAVLEANDYAMVEASSAEAGLKAFKENDVDLVVVDLMMEEVDAGTQLVKDLKFAGADCPVYMLSSVGDEMNLNIDARELGLAGVFQKPVNPPKFIATLKQTLG